MKGQITIFDWLESSKPKELKTCSDCCCHSCLYWWSSRCRYGGCYDDHRAKKNPYDKAFSDKPPRKGWTNWKKPGEQAHWCRGGTFYPAKECEHYTKYEGQTVEVCVQTNIAVFQDGYIICSLKESIGCETCVAQSEGREKNRIYDCTWMTDTGCERMFTAKSLILDAIQEGEMIEPCTEQCCIGCRRICGYRCGQKGAEYNGEMDRKI